MSDSITFISRAAPYGENNGKLCMDIALAAAVFEQKINYVFLDDGVYQLLSNQSPEAIASKPVGAALEAFDLYGIENVYVDKNSLSSRNLTQQELVIKAKVADSDLIAELIQNSKSVINL